MSVFSSHISIVVGLLEGEIEVERLSNGRCTEELRLACMVSQVSASSQRHTDPSLPTLPCIVVFRLLIVSRKALAIIQGLWEIRWQTSRRLVFNWVLFDTVARLRACWQLILEIHGSIQRSFTNRVCRASLCSSSNLHVKHQENSLDDVRVEPVFPEHGSCSEAASPRPVSE